MSKDPFQSNLGNSAFGKSGFGASKLGQSRMGQGRGFLGTLKASWGAGKGGLARLAGRAFGGSGAGGLAKLTGRAFGGSGKGGLSGLVGTGWGGLSTWGGGRGIAGGRGFGDSLGRRPGRFFSGLQLRMPGFLYPRLDTAPPPWGHADSAAADADTVADNVGDQLHAYMDARDAGDQSGMAEAREGLYSTLGKADARRLLAARRELSNLDHLGDVLMNYNPDLANEVMQIRQHAGAIDELLTEYDNAQQNLDNYNIDPRSPEGERVVADVRRNIKRELRARARREQSSARQAIRRVRAYARGSADPDLYEQLFG